MLAGFCINAYADFDFTEIKDSPLKNVRVGFYGDSICAAAADKGTEYESVRGWAGRIGEMHNMRWINHGVSAYSVSNCRGERTIYSQLEPTIDKDYDMIILHGGTNDAWDNVGVGKMTEDFQSSKRYTGNTFASGLEKLFALIRERNPDAVVGYIINFKFINAQKGASSTYKDENGKTVTGSRLNNMADYVEMTKQICDKWGVKYLDLYSNDELTEKLHPYTTDANGKKTYKTTYLSDFIHPTSLGYNVIYPYIEEYMLELWAQKLASETTTAETTVAPIPETTPVITVGEEKKQGGCKSSAGTALFSAITLAGACVVLRKKKRGI